MKPTITRLSAAVLISSTVLSMIGPTESYAATYEGTVNTSILNVRSSTSTSSAIVGKLTKGTAVQVYSTSNNWAQIEFQGQKRYVSSSYLTLKSTVTKAATTKTYTANATVNMRSAMTTSASIVTTIPKGATVTYISTHGATGSWFKVTYGGKTGYVAQRYFSQVGGETVAPQANPTHSTTTNTTMHSSMISTSPTLIAIPKGAKVTFLSEHGTTGSWAKVTYSGKTGYVAKRNLQPLVTVEPTTMYVKTKSSLFSSMSTSGKVVGTLQIATSVKLISTHGTTGSWAKVAAGSLTGYVPMRNLSESQVAEPVTPYYAKQTATMYSSTSTSGNILQTIPVGAKVDQLSAHGATGSWFKVRYANTTGYVAARNFSLTAPSTSTEQYGPELEVQVISSGTPLNVRPTPGTGNAAIGTLIHGTIVKVKPVLNTEWGILTSGSFVGGYIHLSYTAPVTTTPPATGIQRIVSYTDYPMTVRGMAERQAANSGLTDANKTKATYLPRSWVKVTGSTGVITHTPLQTVRSINLQKNPSSNNAEVLATIPSGALLQYMERPSGISTWYKVSYGPMIGYVPASSVVGEAKLLSLDNLNSHVYGHINPGETVRITGQVGNYYLIGPYYRPGGHNVRIYDHVWRHASLSEIDAFTNPDHFTVGSGGFYQFLDLTKNAGTTAPMLNKVLNNNGRLSGTLTDKGQLFIDSGKQYNVNEVYLLAHATHETGYGSSLLSKGVPVDKDGNALINNSGTRIYPERPVAATVYNMYGIRASDSNPVVLGAKFAFEQKWFTPEIAIKDGARWISEQYINHPTYKQNTLYKMRFNPDRPGVHQYATDIGWALKQTHRINNVYSQLNSYTVHFDVPKFQ
ncbi:hypothetical protein EVJ24_09625 [Exiguobacterium sp. SH1S21]|uniref:SH3 domain-containing protein n=1 Tax=Exiguobacterium sp. SH1S21 TaxID=2510953 RepID=UPI00103CD3F7|nr:SH3 domain-containing protein [Exiguobacterium sp. SH1S21]TCI53312.1 hypothetical protein EVJ24_09625 [Exiguobacterium sp. SH1S21]